MLELANALSLVADESSSISAERDKWKVKSIAGRQELAPTNLDCLSPEGNILAVHRILEIAELLI